MNKRGKIAIGMGAGLVWSVALIWIGSTMVEIPAFSRIVVTPFFALAPGIVLVLMIARIAQRRFFDETLIDGQAPVSGSGCDIDQRVLQNTIEQTAVALCLWLPLSYLLLDDGLGVVMTLSVGFAIARVAFWAGYHISPPLRAFGFAATFYPTALALIWGLILRVT